MAIQYNIKAQVVDIRKDSPRKEDAFLVDTNVWFWMTYTRASHSERPPSQYQTDLYPNYTNESLAIGAKIFQSELSFAELTHLIEKAEYEIYSKANPEKFDNHQIFNKRFRHEFDTERENVVKQVESSWAQVISMSTQIRSVIDSINAMRRFRTEKVDGYDLFILESMKNNSVVQIITDDGDYATVPGIQVYTANKNVIKLAKDQGKLFTR